MQTEAKKRKRKIALETGIKFCDNPAFFQEIASRGSIR